MFVRFRRIFALVIDGVILLPVILSCSLWLYNQVVHWSGANINAIEYVLEINRYSVILYIVLIFPTIYVLYELLCYMLFRCTIGQFFMGMTMERMDAFAIVFRSFFSFMLHIMTIGIFSIVNAICAFVSGKTMIDFLSRSQPELIDKTPKKYSLKLFSLLLVIMVTLVASVSVVKAWEQSCFEIVCVETVLLKDAIERQVLQQQLQSESLYERTVQVANYTHNQLENQFSLAELVYVKESKLNYDLFTTSFKETIDVYSIDNQQQIVLEADEQWIFLVRKDSMNQQDWQTYVYDNVSNSFLPVRTVFSIASENSYQWMLNVTSAQLSNEQWNLFFNYDFGNVSEISFEK
ncbi:MAG: RDD family protein [Culicoidibacterales bacterium]